jgi:hypothetical protein
LPCKTGSSKREKTLPEVVYQEMGKFLELSGVEADYRGNILVSEKDWQKLKRAGTELDEIVG